MKFINFAKIFLYLIMVNYMNINKRNIIGELIQIIKLINQDF